MPCTGISLVPTVVMRSLYTASGFFDITQAVESCRDGAGKRWRADFNVVECSCRRVVNVAASYPASMYKPVATRSVVGVPSSRRSSPRPSQGL